MSIFARMLRPKVVAITRRPVGFAVGRHGWQRVLAWGVCENGSVVGLVPDRRGGLRPTVGRGWLGYLPGAPTSEGEVQREPPPVKVPPVDLVEAIGQAHDPWTPEALGEVYARLRLAADDEFALKALAVFVADPHRFLVRHFELIAEHGRRADLDDAWLDQFAAIKSPAVAAALNPVIAEEAHP